MASVSDRPRARKPRTTQRTTALPTPPADPPAAPSLPEGWQPGGAATRPAPARPFGPVIGGQPIVPVPATSSDVVRHGKCSLVLSIGGTRYKLRPMACPPGLASVWRLEKLTADPADRPACYAVAADEDGETHCTCPDHRVNGCTCKHIGSLRALHLIPARRQEGGAL